MASPFTTSIPRKFSAFQVPAFLEKLVEVINAKLPARATLLQDGDKLTIEVVINRLELPAGVDGDGQSGPSGAELTILQS
jgi:hypothetical protein